MDWNELEFLGWDEFKQMAPSIIQLEISRIGKLIDAAYTEIDFRNALVIARFSMKKFIENLDETESPPLDETCLAHLNKAILTLSTALSNQKPGKVKIVNYILDRLQGLLNKSKMLY